jgi:DNA sulfur modification protein DndD
MYLRSVELRDWRSYRKAHFEFPKPTNKKNVILIKAPNEHGKTSLFEAITLCLFGRDGLILLPRARIASDGEVTDKLAATYGRFLSGILHRRAIQDSRFSCSAAVTFEDDDGDTIEIRRRWYFRADGTHKAADDDLTIFEGENRRPLAAPATVTNTDEWYRDYIAKKFIPASLAEFFLFDGEQVQRYATRGMAAQVRMGIEGLLGLPLLRSTKESLERYATVRRTSVAAPSDIVVNSIKKDISEYENNLERLRIELAEADALLPALESERDDLIARIGGGNEGTVANLQELLRIESAYDAEAERITQDLLKLLATDISIAVAGSELRQSALTTLIAEEKRESWESGRRQGNTNLDRYLSDVEQRLNQLENLQIAGKEREIIDCVKQAWDALWYPAPDGCADVVRHVAVVGTTRAKAIDKLRQIIRHSEKDLVDLVEKRERTALQAESKRKERQEAEQRAPENEAYGQKLAIVSAQHGELQEKRRQAQKEIDAIEGQLAAKRQELGRHTDKIEKGGPDLARANLAEKAITVIESILKEAVPSQVGFLAEEMTTAWKSMAHLTERVERIEITPECEVKMLTKKGENIHDIEKSAGGSQVFTQALIVAVTKVSQRSFPFVVDTPLARLSKDQRIGVLKTFCAREGQVVLLATDTEVVGDERAAISDRIQASFELKVAIEDGIAVTSVQKEPI